MNLFIVGWAQLNCYTYPISWLNIDFPFDITLDASLLKSWYPCLYFKYLLSLRVFLKDCMSLLYILTADVLRIISSMYIVEADFITTKSYSKRAVLGVVSDSLPRLSSKGKSWRGWFSCSDCFLIRQQECNHASKEKKNRASLVLKSLDFRLWHCMTHSGPAWLSSRSILLSWYHPYFLGFGSF